MSIVWGAVPLDSQAIKERPGHFFWCWIDSSELTFEDGSASLLVNFIFYFFVANTSLVGVSISTLFIFYLRLFSMVVFTKKEQQMCEVLCT